MWVKLCVELVEHQHQLAHQRSPSRVKQLGVMKCFAIQVWIQIVEIKTDYACQKDFQLFDDKIKVNLLDLHALR